jgi:hypothetical protein
MIEMKVWRRYIVTKGSTDGTFEVGDHISLNPDGSINCIEAQGWIEADDVASATEGMEVETDLEWYGRRKQKLLDEVDAMEIEE